MDWLINIIIGIGSAVVGWFLRTFYPRIESRFKRHLIFSYEFFPIRIASLFHHKIDRAEKSINVMYENLRPHLMNNIKELEGIEKIHDSLSEFIRNLQWLYLSDFVMKIVLLNRGTRDLKDLSISFTFLSQLTGYQFKWAEEHEIEEPLKIFKRDKVKSIKTIKTLKTDKPIVIFIWGVVLEELKEEYAKEDFNKVIDNQLFVSYSGNNKGVKKRKIRI